MALSSDTSSVERAVVGQRRSRRRLLATGVLVAYLAALGWALLAPTSTDQSRLVLWLGRHLGQVGVPDQLTAFDRLEVVMNAAIVAPVSLLGTFVLRSWSWRDWTAWAFVASGCVELTQGLLLSGRQASFSDVVANTTGAFLGAMIAIVVRWRLAVRDRAEARSVARGAESDQSRP